MKKNTLLNTLSVATLLGLTTLASAIPPPQPIGIQETVINQLIPDANQSISSALVWQVETVSLSGPNPIDYSTSATLQGYASTYYPTGTLTLTEQGTKNSCTVQIGANKTIVLMQTGTMSCQAMGTQEVLVTRAEA